jgi:hypothetical protein
LEITVSFLGIHKWEPDIYIGFSPTLHLRCRDFSSVSRFQEKEKRGEMITINENIK